MASGVGGVEGRKSPSTAASGVGPEVIGLIKLIIRLNNSNSSVV